MIITKNIIRKFLRLWARIGVAPGYLHQIVDRYSTWLYTKPLTRKIAGGGKILCDLRDHVESRIYFFGAYEPIEAYLFCQLIRPDMHIVDAGANIGFYSLLASSRLSTRGKVFSFEPIPSNIEKLKLNIQRSHKPKIKVIEKGLWNKKEVIKFSLAQEFIGNEGSYSASRTKGAKHSFNCPVEPLDAFIDSEEIPKVDLIKMDIEGAELFALKGAKNLIQNQLPSILIEINQDACKKFNYNTEKIDKFLLPLGYKIFRIESLPSLSGYIESTSNLKQSNVFFVSPKDQSRFKCDWNYKKIKKEFAKSKLKIANSDNL